MPARLRASAAEHFNMPFDQAEIRNGRRVFCLTDGCMVSADRVEHVLLELGGRIACDTAGFGPSLLHDRVRQIVPVAYAEFVGVRWASPLLNFF